MNYERPGLLEQLAGEYVLGALRGSARARFERLESVNPAARAARHRWEDRLMPLLSSATPVTPGDRVWTEIARRIRGQEPATPRVRFSRRWAWAAAFALVVIVGGTLRWLNPPQQSVAALGTDATHPLWSVSRTKDSSALTITARQLIQDHPERAYELWALPPGGKAPVSLGLLPRSGRLERRLTPLQQNALMSASRVAVSLEPAGGSPTGGPTGPILFVADVSQPG
jgi:anti-sigma-K factor RskA